ncbi:hypothetical protein TKK_0011304 [Trichogramma kaykai]
MNQPNNDPLQPSKCIKCNRETVFKCNHCAFLFTSGAEAQEHFINFKCCYLTEAGTFKCNQCTFTTVYKRSLKDHMENIHNSNSPSMHTCKKCGNWYKYRGNMLRHQKAHKLPDDNNGILLEDQEAANDIIALDVIRNSESSLDIIRLPSGPAEQATTAGAAAAAASLTLNPEQEQKYPCDNCSSVFSRKCNLYYHRKYECGQPPRFQCPYCRYRTRHQSNVRAHVKRIHCGLQVYFIDVGRQNVPPTNLFY